MKTFKIFLEEKNIDDPHKKTDDLYKIGQRLHERTASTLSAQDHKNVKAYTRSSATLNKNLIRGEKLLPAHKEIHETIKRESKPIGEHITLYSGTGDKDFSEMVKKSKDGILHCPAHISATHDHDVASQFAHAVGGKSQMIHIHMKPEDKGLHVSNLGNFIDEHETIIPAETKLKYLRTEKKELTGGLIHGKPVTVHHFEIHSQD